MDRLSEEVFASIKEKSPVPRDPQLKKFNAHIDWLESLTDLVEGITSHSDLFMTME
jgi:hypothetical protein